MMTRQFHASGVDLTEREAMQSMPGPGSDSPLIAGADIRSHVLYGWDPTPPVRYATLFPMTFRPNPLPASYQLNFSMGLGSG